MKKFQETQNKKYLILCLLLIASHSHAAGPVLKQTDVPRQIESVATNNTIDNFPVGNLDRTGQSGQIIQSNGNGSPPTWSSFTISSAPVFMATAYNSNASIVGGTTFYFSIPDSAITIIRVTGVVAVAGNGGTGDVWSVGTSGANKLTATTSASAPIGTNATNTGSIAVPAGTTIKAWIDQPGTPTTQPAGNLIYEYKMQ